MNIAIYLHFYLNPPPDLEAPSIARKHVETEGVDGGFWFCGKLGRKSTTISE